MTNNWHNVWSKKKSEQSKNSTLAQLLALDGFDVFGGMDESAWLEHSMRMADLLEIDKDSSIYEVGCGSGAFLYPFYQQGNQVAGNDYAENLVEIAKKAMPGSDIKVKEAIETDVDEKFDIVLSHGVFLYFQNYDYAAATIKRMLAKSHGKVGILDIPDLSKKKYAMKLRRTQLGEENYKRKYEGLDHLYFAKEWFIQLAETMEIDIDITDQQLPGYTHNSYRYNVTISIRSS